MNEILFMEKCHETYKARKLINGHVIVIAYELIVIEMMYFLMAIEWRS